VRSRITDDGTYPLVEEELAKVEERAIASSPSDPPDAVLAYVTRKKDGHLYFLVVWNVHDGCWSFPGGRHDPRDGSLRETVTRELAEETGLTGNAVELLHDAAPVDASRVRRVFVYRVHVAEDAVARPLEAGTRIGWFTEGAFAAEMIGTKLEGFFSGFFAALAGRKGPIAADNAALAARLRSTGAVPVPKDKPTFVRWRFIGTEPHEYLTESLGEGYFCRVAGCQAWNSDMKEPRTTCRCCGASRPRRA